METLIKLRNVTLNWAHLATPDPKYGKFSVQIMVSADEAAALKEAGVNVKEQDGKPFIKVNENPTWPSGDPKDPPRVVDQAVQVLDPAVVKKIGNGTTANVNVLAKSYKNSFGEGVSTYLKGIQIVELKEYAGNGGDDFDVIAESKEFM